MLLDPRDARPAAAWRARSLDRADGRPALQARAAGRAAGDRRCRRARTVAEAVAALRGRAPRPRWRPPRGGRAARGGGRASVRGPEGVLNRGRALRPDRAPSTASIARRQLVCALQVHVAVGGAERSLAVYNALRALPARAAPRSPPTRPFHERRATPGWPRCGRRSASCCRARACRRRSRRGRRSPTRSRGAPRAGAVPEPRRWWWELRPHPALRDARGARARRAGDGRGRGRGRGGGPRARRAGSPRATTPASRSSRRRRWRIEENRWSACRDGVEGDAGRPADGRARRHARAAARAARPSSRRPPRARLRGGARARARAGRAQRRAAPARPARRRRAPRPSGSPTSTSRRRVHGQRAPACRERSALPDPARRALRGAARRALREPPASAAADPAADATTRSPTRTCTSRSTLLLRAALPRAPRASTTAGSGTRRCSRCARALEARLRGGAARAVGRPARRAPAPDGDGPRAARDRRRRRRPVALAPPRARRRTLEQVREFVVHRSAYQLKEADPHSWAIPRLSGRAEGGAGRDPGRRVRRRAARAHARAAVRRRDGRARARRRATAPTSTALPGVTLATVNLMSLFGLHRRLRGAIVGHLALFEMTSSMPNRRYARGLRRLGFDDPAATEFFDEHVEADAVHENARRGRPRRRPRPPAAGAGRRHPVGRAGARRRRGALGAGSRRRVGGRALVAAHRARPPAPA